MTKHDIVIFRIHDHMHRQRPDFTFSGTAREVGLDPMTETAPNSHRFVIPETTLGELAARVKKVRGDDAIRVVGDPNAKVSRIATGAGMATPAVNAADVDVVIGGEQREIEGTFDSPEYVMDAATLGVAQGLDHHRPQHVRGVGHAGNGGLAAADRAGSEGPARPGRHRVLGAEVRLPQPRRRRFPNTLSEILACRSAFLPTSSQHFQRHLRLRSRRQRRARIPRTENNTEFTSVRHS